MLITQIQYKEILGSLSVDVTLYTTTQKVNIDDFVSNYQVSSGYYYTLEDSKIIDLKVEFYGLLTSKYIDKKSNTSNLISQTSDSLILSEKTFQVKEKLYEYKKYHFDFELPVQRVQYTGELFSMSYTLVVQTDSSKQGTTRIPLEFEKRYENYTPISYDIMFERTFLSKFIFHRVRDTCNFYFSQMSLDEIHVDVIQKEFVCGKAHERILYHEEKYTTNFLNFDFSIYSVEHPEIVPQGVEVKTTNSLRFKFIKGPSVLKWEIPLKGPDYDLVASKEIVFCKSD